MPPADRAARDRFLAAHAQKAEVLRPAPDRAVLQVGDDGLPLPHADGPAAAACGASIPPPRGRRSWTAASAATSSTPSRRCAPSPTRRTTTPRTAGRQGAFRAYARRLFSSPGQRDGLYWPTAEGEPPSPLGPFVAAASAGGYARPRPGDAPQPFHGYLFRHSGTQGPAAPGGEMDYVVNGRMIGGLAAIATPYRCGSTGIMTFMSATAARSGRPISGRRRRASPPASPPSIPAPGWERVPPPNAR